MSSEYEERPSGRVLYDRVARRVKAVERNVPDPVTLNQIRQKESILLSRTRIVTELKSAQNPRYRDLLNRSLADLEAKLSTL